MTLKRLTAWMLTLMMIVSCVPASAVEGSVFDYSASTSAYDVMPLSDGEENITVTFVIDKSEYTNDPDSGGSHVRSTAAIEGGELTYTLKEIDTGEDYVVTGTGTVCSYSIPAGTSLSENGYSFPPLTPADAGEGSRYSYNSLLSWVTAGKMVCHVDTVFNENTTLYLQLFETGSTVYSINFVCSDDGHSYMSIGNLAMGQALSQERIDAATSAANAYNKSWCNYGIKSGQQIAKWQFKVTATGEMVDLKAGTPIAEAYVNEQYGNSIRAYAVWEDIPSTVTATFQYASSYDETTGDPVYTTVESRELNAGDALGTLPDMTELTPEGSTFIGWQYADADGNLMYATAETVINADTTYTAVFGTLVTATFKYVTCDEETDTDVEQIIETRQLNAGDALGTLPDMSAYENPLWVLAGWYNEADAESEEIEYITAETVITENATYIAEFSYPECGYVTLIDILPDGSIRDGIEPNISLPVGMTIAEGIAANEEYDGFVLTDDTLASACIWRTADGELADLTEVVTAETDISLYTYTYQIILTLNPNTAAEAEGIMTLSLVETETNEDTGVITMTITAREGEQLTENDFIVNGTDLTQYAWTDSEGNAVDLRALTTTGVTGSITATSDGTLAAADEFTLTFNLTRGDEMTTYTVTKAAGEVFAATDFVVNGVDLIAYAWTENDVVLPLTSLVGTTLTADRTLESDGTLTSSSLTEHPNHWVNFYVFVDNQRELVSSQSVVDFVGTFNSSTRHALSANTLESVYGAYGFSADSLTDGNQSFAHVDSGGSTIWVCTADEVDGSVYVPTVLHEGNVDVYYLPKQTLAGSASYTAHSAANSFYTVTVSDVAGIVYTADELPERTITLTGGTTSMTVEAPPEGMSWVCEGQDDSIEDNYTVVDNGDGSITYTFTNISEPYVIKIEGAVKVAYDLALPQTPADTEYGTPKVMGVSDYSEILEIADADTYTVKAPAPTSYFYKYGKYLGEATFLGWALNGDTTNLIQPGTVIDLSDYDGQSVTLTAQWQQELGGTASIWNSTMLNFFVALNAVSEGTEAWEGNTDTSYFTQSVYTTDSGVTGAQVIVSDNHNSNQIYYLGGTSGTDLNANHDLIVSALSAGYTHTSEVDGQEYVATASFPSDETVLRNVRQMIESGSATIKINERVISAEEMTTANFTVKWYVYKFDKTDGWHIDGILVAKSGEMIVTKTFAGDEAAISAIKTNFTIDVASESAPVHPSAGLQITNATSVSGNTYTWKVPVDQYYDYTVTENNYIYDVNLATYKAQYRVRNSNVDSQNKGWTSYSSSSNITVTGRGYNETDNERLQVDFLNTYTAPGTVVVQKIDAVTGNLMPNVSFKIGGTTTAGATLQMYHVQGSHYSADSTFGGTLTDTITTDASGQAYLWIGGGDYWLEEVVPDGYDDPGRITVTLEGESETSYKVIAIKNPSAGENGENTEKFLAIGGSDNLTLIVKNYSRLIDLTVTKNWLDGENKPVTIQLYRDGNPLGTDYTVTFDGTTDSKETSAWSCTFTGLPLYADGGLAQYTIREEKIGDFSYSDEYLASGGYLYYNVTYSDMKYLDGEVETDDMTAVDTIALEVSNERRHGSLVIAKVDESGSALAGATFALYDAADVGSITSKDALSGFDPEYTATSAANGTVDFGDVEAGRYYMIEQSAPTGYTGSDLLYFIQFDGLNSTMFYYATSTDETGTVTGSWTSTAKRVVNESNKTDVTVTKQWADASNSYARRPTTITVTLTGTDSDGKVVSTQTVNITDSNSDSSLGSDGTTVASDTWTYTFDDLPQYVGGKAVTYTVTENTVPGYTTTYDQDKLEITNTLISDLTYTVNKQIKGNFADPTKKFEFTAVVKDNTGNTIKTETFKLTGGASWTITGIPYGASVMVTEVPDGYSAEYMLGNEVFGGESYTSGAIVDDSQGVTFINTKNVTIETGVDLDGLPYTMLLLGAAGLGLIWLMTARRRRNEN